MTFPLVLLATALNHVSFKGSKVLLSLFAIELGASPFTIGVLFAMYSVFPVLLSVHAGKLADRLGARTPMLFGASGLAAGLLLPFAAPGIAALYFSAAVVGLGYIFYVVAVQHLVGSFGEGVARTRNYSLFSITVGVTALVGPVTAGFAIDGFGHRGAYLLLAAIPLAPIALIALRGGALPAPARGASAQPERRLAALVQNAPLRRALLAAAILETGMELSNFLIPIYARSIGLEASEVGLVMGAFGLALLIVRSATTELVRRSGEEAVLAVSLVLAACASLAFPFVGAFAPLAAVAFALGLGLGCGAPISLSLAYNRAPAGRSGEAIGLRQTVNKGIEVIMPLLFGSISTAFGMLPVFWLEALLLAAGGWLMRSDARRQARRARVL
jgi:MFS family permease